jgi:hypothetical protein
MSRSTWLNIDKNYPYAFIAISILALSIRLIGLDKGIWLDEDFTINMISKGSLWEMLQTLRKDPHPPLHYVLLYFWKLLATCFGNGNCLFLCLSRDRQARKI